MWVRNRRCQTGDLIADAELFGRLAVERPVQHKGAALVHVMDLVKGTQQTNPPLDGSYRTRELLFDGLLTHH